VKAGSRSRALRDRLGLVDRVIGGDANRFTAADQSQLDRVRDWAHPLSINQSTVCHGK